LYLVSIGNYIVIRYADDSPAIEEQLILLPVNLANTGIDCQHACSDEQIIR
jgi:hypothetical protein